MLYSVVPLPAQVDKNASGINKSKSLHGRHLVLVVVYTIHTCIMGCIFCSF